MFHFQMRVKKEGDHKTLMPFILPLFFLLCARLQLIFSLLQLVLVYSLAWVRFCVKQTVAFSLISKYKLYNYIAQQGTGSAEEPLKSSVI